MIKIVGLGPGDRNALTVGTMETLLNSEFLFLRTDKHPVAEYLKDKKVKFNSYDYMYKNLMNFDIVYQNIAENLIAEQMDKEDIVYAVPGSPLESEKSVSILIELCKKNKVEYKIIPSVSFLDTLVNGLEIDPTDGLRIVDAFDIGNVILDKRQGTIITQVYNNLIASEVKIKLSNFFDDETEVFYCKAMGIEGKESIKKIKLYELDMQEYMDYLSYIYIPKDLNNKKDIYDLSDLIEILRGERGCPWDKEQTHESIRKSIIEESYEVCDAIDKQDVEGLIEELGDVLFQVIFHASLGKEEEIFDMGDVIQAIYEKMVYRHPHVFGNKKLQSSNEVVVNWEELKKKEKNFESITDEMKGVANALPALIRAKKVQNKAKKVGFDFDSVEEAMEKVKEEINEVLDVYKCEDKAIITEEIGDLLFSCVNVSRFLQVDSEEALKITTDKFINRFKYIEEKASDKSIKLEDMTINEMNCLWNEAKNIKN